MWKRIAVIHTYQDTWAYDERSGWAIIRRMPLLLGVCAALASLLFAVHLEAAGPLAGVTGVVSDVTGTASKVVGGTTNTVSDTVGNVGAAATESHGPSGQPGTAGGSSESSAARQSDAGIVRGASDAATHAVTTTTDAVARATDTATSAVAPPVQAVAQPAAQAGTITVAPAAHVVGSLTQSAAPTINALAAPLANTAAVTSQPATAVTQPAIQSVTTITQPAAAAAPSLAASVVQPVAPVVSAIAPPVRTVTQSATTVVTPVTQAVAPIASPVTATLQTVAAPVTPIIAPVATSLTPAVQSVQTVIAAIAPVASSLPPIVPGGSPPVGVNSTVAPPSPASLVAIVPTMPSLSLAPVNRAEMMRSVTTPGTNDATEARAEPTALLIAPPSPVTMPHDASAPATIGSVVRTAQRGDAQRGDGVPPRAIRAAHAASFVPGTLLPSLPLATAMLPARNPATSHLSSLSHLIRAEEERGSVPTMQVPTLPPVQPSPGNAPPAPVPQNSRASGGGHGLTALLLAALGMATLLGSRRTTLPTLAPRQQSYRPAVSPA